jgi:hypothetical protein
VSDPAPPSVKLQILATEHWSLLASRSLAWTEAFSRANMFISALSGAVVALALAVQASGFGRTFTLFALAILPIVFYLGVTTFIRLGSSNYHDAQCVIGMNRIRSAYLELAPELEKYFVMSPHDDFRGLNVTMGVVPRRNPLVHMISSTPAVVAVLTSVIAAVIAVMVGKFFAWPPIAIAACGVVVFAAGFGLLTWWGRRRIKELQRSLRPINPSPNE